MKNKIQLTLHQVLVIAFNALFILISTALFVVYAVTQNQIYLTIAFSTMLLHAILKIVGLILDNNPDYTVLYIIFIVYNIITCISCILISLGVTDAKWLLAILVILEIVSIFTPHGGGLLYFNDFEERYMDVPLLFALTLISLYVYSVTEIVNIIKDNSFEDDNQSIQTPPNSNILK